MATAIENNHTGIHFPESWKRADLFADNIMRTATKFKIPVDLLFAICKQESNFIATAIRWEPHFYHKYVKPRADVPFEEAVGWACSWGLMQIMGATARYLGYKNALCGLWQPIINLDWGCKYLNKLMKRYDWNEEYATAAYNAGSVRKNEDGTYVNQTYVDKIAKWRKEFNAGSKEVDS